MNENARTILLVDDDSVVRGLVKTCLEKAGYSVLAAADGVEALAVYKEHKADIAMLLADVIMPKLTGLELADCILEMDRRLPVLFISGNAMNADRGHGCVTKPFTPAGLIGRIRHALAIRARTAHTKTRAA